MANLYVDSGYVNDGFIQTGITIYWGSRVIFVPKSETTLIQASPTEIREIDINAFRIVLKDLEDGEEGMAYPTTHNHVAPISVGGVTLARVVELINNYTVTFEDGLYAVNIVGGNSNIGDRVNVNKVSVRSANSAGLVQSSEIEQASYSDRVSIDQTNSTGRAQDGVLFPVGTLQAPVANLSDAKFIADFRGLDDFYLLGNFTLASTDDVSDLKFRAAIPATLNVAKTTVTFTAGCNTTDTHWHEVKVTGYQGGEAYFVDCIIDGLDNAHCMYERCGFLDGTARGYSIRQNNVINSGHASYFKECYSDEGIAIIDRNGAHVNATFDGWSGRIKFINQNAATNSGSVLIHLTGGTVIVDSSCTKGTITVTGFGTIIDQSGGTVVDATGLFDNTNQNIEKALKLIKIVFARS